jgi:hypothetical protein
MRSFPSLPLPSVISRTLVLAGLLSCRDYPFSYLFVPQKITVDYSFWVLSDR